MVQRKILVVDDEMSVRKTIRLALEAEGYDVETAENGKETFEKTENADFDVVLLDLRLPDTDGMDILRHLINRGSEAIVIVITAHGTIDSAVEAVKSGAYHYITKPVDMENLKHALGEALENKRLREENMMLRETLDSKGAFSGIIYQSKQMQEVVDITKMAAGSDNNILITGPTGTGKELISDAIHFNSRRRKNNYLRINCAVLPETILESELFGHEKGSFTDAKSRKKGIFELTDKGTILFDEIGCMSIRTQSKLLRVLEDKTVRRIGGEKEFRVDVRIIASTNEDIEEAIKKETFRPDLFYRLNVVKISLPSLRDRKDDIPILANHFVRKHCRIEKRNEIKITPEAMEMLLEYDWPGNIRELENVIQRALIFDIDKYIGVEHLPKDFKETERKICIQMPDRGASYKDFTEELLRQVLHKTDGNKSKAAEILGVSREFIRRHLPKESDE